MKHPACNVPDVWPLEKEARKFFFSSFIFFPPPPPAVAVQTWSKKLEWSEQSNYTSHHLTTTFIWAAALQKGNCWVSRQQTFFFFFYFLVSSVFFLEKSGYAHIEYQVNVSRATWISGFQHIWLQHRPRTMNSPLIYISALLLPILHRIVSMDPC